MKRRVVVRALGASITAGTVGCIGGGSEVVTTVQREVTVRPGQGWFEKIPDLEGSGGAIQYKVTAGQPFDVYFFVGEDEFMAYDAYVDGDDPDRMPTGDRDVGTKADKEAKDRYGATSKNDGGREPIEEEGPYFFVVDHSAYREETPPGEQPEKLSAFVDLTVSKQQLL